MTKRHRFVRFSGFTVDVLRASLLDSAGNPRRLRPKSFDMLCFLAHRSGQIVSKDDLLLGVWGHTNLDDDGLTQCAREIRVALDDSSRTLLKTIPKRGYLLDGGPVEYDLDTADETGEPRLPPEPKVPDAASERATRGLSSWELSIIRPWRLGMFAVLAVLGAGFLLSERASPAFSPTLVLHAVTPLDAEPDTAAIAASVTDRLWAGLSNVPDIHLSEASQPPARTGQVVASADRRELHGAVSREGGELVLRLRMVDSGTQEIVWATTAELVAPDLDERRRNKALVGKAGTNLARFINQWVLGPYPEPPGPATRLVMNEARSYLQHISRERQQQAEALYRAALRSDPGSVEIMLALAKTQLIAVANIWYEQKDRDEKSQSIRKLVDDVLRRRPGDYDALQANCMDLRAAASFDAALLACAAVLQKDPWSVRAMKERGYAQLYLGRVGDALESFQQVEETDPTDPLSWTWREGAGIACLLLDRNVEAADWLQRSIATAPGTGRADLLLAATYLRLGRRQDAVAAISVVRAAGFNIRETALPKPTAQNLQGKSMERLKSTIDQLAELP